MTRGTASVVSGHCGICPSGCAVRITVEEDRIARVAPNPRHPHGMCCRRVGRRGRHPVVSGPLLFPLKRTGARGDDSFQRIGWDEALDTLAAGLRDIAARFGPQAVCLYTGRGTFEQSLWEMLSPAGVRETCAWSLLFPFGSPNTTGAGSNCYVSHAVLAPVTTFGTWWADTSPDLESARMIVVWGTNPANASPPELMRRIERAAKRGAEVVVIDHRRTETAQRVGAEWLAVRPGTDGALALSMINVLLEEGLHDREFAERWTLGFEELRGYVRRFTPEGDRADHGDPRGSDTAHRPLHCATRRQHAPLLHRPGVHNQWRAEHPGGHDALGPLRQPGRSGWKPDPDAGRRFPGERVPAVWSPPDGVEPVGKGVYPLYHRYRKEAHAMEIPRAILENDPYPVRGMLVWGASIITGYPNPALWRKAFSALDFLVTVDRFPTEDSRYADLILPAATSFEEDSYLVTGDRVELRRKVIEPLGESRSDWQIVAGIAERLGYGHLFPRSAHEMLQWAFEGTSIDLDELEKSPDGVWIPVVPMRYRKWESGLLRRDGTPGFETPSGKFEIASRVLADHGYDALPVYAPPREGPEGSPAHGHVSPHLQLRRPQHGILLLPAPRCSRPRAAETAPAGLHQPSRCASSGDRGRRRGGGGNPSRQRPVQGAGDGGHRGRLRGG